MSIRVILGCQWGDEGKGKIVDLLAQESDWVARFQGGANAGHTMIREGRPVVLHLVPSGILHPAVRCAIGNGVVLDAQALVEEIRYLQGMGISLEGRLRISACAHLATPIHRAYEALTAVDRAIGTTGRGIGPAYADKVIRRGLRAEDLLAPARFRDRLASLWETLRRACGADEQAFDAAVGDDFGAVAARLEEAGVLLGPWICDLTDLLLSEDDRGARILAEGAQGAWLDIDHGTYPFVTSSNTTIGGVCTGLGVPPQRIRRVIGVVKAYATRVGLGPFPTEFSGQMAVAFRERAGEFGATTRRPRRCGWYDAVLARRSCRINGVDELIVTKLDILREIEPVKLANAYRMPETEADSAPGVIRFSTRELERSVPKYREFAGWQDDLSACRSWEALPAAARHYLEGLAEETGVPVGAVSVGPARHEIVKSSP
ncbi:MAG: adenylosuccinate synthase [Candidatus Eisenbacteria sp.]|nr:adenylosuccinate synthase [Candidatus Eisenbacteria bacterium]